MERKRQTNDETHTISSIDVGSHNVSVFIGEYDSNGRINVVGIGEHPSQGMSNGLIVNIDSTVDAITSAVAKAESIANVRVDKAFVSISGSHVSGMNLSGSTALRSGEVRDKELNDAMATAQAISIAANEELIHVVPQDFVVDNQFGIQDPLGIAGVRLEAHVHLITCASNALQNLTKCMTQCSIGVEGVIVSPLASASSILTPDDLELGVCLVDIGGGTTDIAVYSDGALRHTEVLTLAGDAVTRDISRTLRTPPQCAENLKVMYACAMQNLVHENELLRAPGVGDRPARDLSRQTLAAVVEPRLRELFEKVQQILSTQGFLQDPYSLGIVLTGGASQLEGITELAESVFLAPVALGRPFNVSASDMPIKNLAYATGTGLLTFGLNLRKRSKENLAKETRSFGRRVKRWIQNNV